MRLQTKAVNSSNDLKDKMCLLCLKFSSSILSFISLTRFLLFTSIDSRFKTDEDSVSSESFKSVCLTEGL